MPTRKKKSSILYKQSNIWVTTAVVLSIVVLAVAVILITAIQPGEALLSSSADNSGSAVTESGQTVSVPRTAGPCSGLTAAAMPQNLTVTAPQYVEAELKDPNAKFMLQAKSPEMDASIARRANNTAQQNGGGVANFMRLIFKPNSRAANLQMNPISGIYYEIDWGDGSPKTGAIQSAFAYERGQFGNATHTYAEPGNYNVSVTARYNCSGYPGHLASGVTAAIQKTVQAKQALSSIPGYVIPGTNVYVRLAETSQQVKKGTDQFASAIPRGTKNAPVVKFAFNSTNDQTTNIEAIKVKHSGSILLPVTADGITIGGSTGNLLGTQIWPFPVERDCPYLAYLGATGAIRLPTTGTPRAQFLEMRQNMVIPLSSPLQAKPNALTPFHIGVNVSTDGDGKFDSVVLGFGGARIGGQMKNFSTIPGRVVPDNDNASSSSLTSAAGIPADGLYDTNGDCVDDRGRR